MNLNKIKITLIVFTAAILSLIWFMADEQRQISQNYDRIAKLTDTVEYYRQRRLSKHNIKNVDTLFVHHIIFQHDDPAK